jgi:hypothetical protein
MLLLVMLVLIYAPLLCIGTKLSELVPRMFFEGTEGTRMDGKASRLFPSTSSG